MVDTRVAVQSKYDIVRRALASARRAKQSNIRSRGVMSSPPTITPDGTTAPAGQTTAFNRSAFPAGLFRETGGQWYASGSKLKSAIIWTSGGNLGDGAGGQVNWWRIGFSADAAKVTFRLTGAATTAKYRFIVDGQYVDLTGTATLNTSGTEYITLDFSSIGGRARREIILEGQPGCTFTGVYVGANETVGKLPDPEFRSVIIGDSWVQGSAATALGDGPFAHMADRLGFEGHMNSGSGGTGWDQSSPTAYNFLQRIQNGDEALNGVPTGPIFLMGSINDKNASASNITTRCAAAIALLRSRYPVLPIIGFGVAPVNGGTGGTLALVDNEAAVKAAFDQFSSDKLVQFKPVVGAVGGCFVASGATTGHPLMFDTSHLNDAGCRSAGAWYADQTMDALAAMAA